MDDLVRVRLVRVSHPDTKSSVRRSIYNVLKSSAVDTPFGFILLNPDAWRRLEELNDRGKAEVGRDVITYVDVYIPRNQLISILRSALSEAEPTSSKALLIAAALRSLAGGRAAEALGEEI